MMRNKHVPDVPQAPSVLGPSSILRHKGAKALLAILLLSSRQGDAGNVVEQMMKPLGKIRMLSRDVKDWIGENGRK